MRADEAVDITAEELKRRGACTDFATQWRVSAMEKQAAGFSPLALSRSAAAADGCRFSDEEFVLLLALWLGGAGPACGPGVPGK